MLLTSGSHWLPKMLCAQWTKEGEPGTRESRKMIHQCVQPDHDSPDSEEILEWVLVELSLGVSIHSQSSQECTFPSILKIHKQRRSIVPGPRPEWCIDIVCRLKKTRAQFMILINTCCGNQKVPLSGFEYGLVHNKTSPRGSGLLARILSVWAERTGYFPTNVHFYKAIMAPPSDLLNTCLPPPHLLFFFFLTMSCCIISFSPDVKKTLHLCLVPPELWAEGICVLYYLLVFQILY